MLFQNWIIHISLCVFVVTKMKNKEITALKLLAHDKEKFQSKVFHNQEVSPVDYPSLLMSMVNTANSVMRENCK